MKTIVDQLKRLWPKVDAAPFSIDEFTRSAADGIDFKLPPLLYQLKNPAFREEKEWRVLLTYKTDVDERTLPVKYFASRNKLTPYIEVEYKKISNPISAVLIGPKNITPAQVVKSFVQSNGVNADISVSSATYR
jgi:hypothetical protein